MSVTRPNILKASAALRKFCDGVKRLKYEFPGTTTEDVGIPGPVQKLGTYDLFVVWHVMAMMTMTPSSEDLNPLGRNAAHRGPVFLPWHRFMLRQLELNLQRVLNDPAFGLPYWDWAADGELAPGDQPNAPLWAQTGIGGSGSPVTTGPFVFNPDDPSSFRVRVAMNGTGAWEPSTNRGLNRGLGLDPRAPALPTKADTAAAFTQSPYDTSEWTAESAGFRNRLEGWIPRRSLHNLVHVWVSGDMFPASSPNDPVFFLNHCNVDRIWEAWMQKNGRVYLPGDDASDDLKGHRLHDELSALISATTTPAAVLDSTQQFVYDSLDV